jgi:hypothetical protein
VTLGGGGVVIAIRKALDRGMGVRVYEHCGRIYTAHGGCGHPSISFLSVHCPSGLNCFTAVM